MESKILFKLVAPAIIIYLLNNMTSMSTQIFGGHLGYLELAAYFLANNGYAISIKHFENTPSEFSSRMSASRPEMPLTREPIISSSRRFPDLSENLKNFPVQTPMIGSLAGASGSGISTPGYANTPSSTRQLAFGSRAPVFYSQANFPQSGIVPVSGSSQGFFSCEWFNMIVHHPSVQIRTGSGGGCLILKC